MRDLFFRLSRLCLPALLLAVALAAWSPGVQAGEAMHHQTGEAMPCHEQAATEAPGDRHDTAGHGCPDCRCPAAGCASAALPGMTGTVSPAFSPAPLRAVPAIRLETQALVGPPAEPPRL